MPPLFQVGEETLDDGVRHHPRGQRGGLLLGRPAGPHGVRVFHRTHLDLRLQDGVQGPWGAGAPLCLFHRLLLQHLHGGAR